MSESTNKQMKILRDLSEDLVVRVSSFLPIQSLLQNCSVSKTFKHTEIKSLDLDFRGIYSVRRKRSNVVCIINNIINNHVGREIHRFALILNHIGVEDNILSWINVCIEKNIQELVLDFSKSKKVMMMPIDFSVIKTLRVLKLRWCQFQNDSSSNGLRLLRTLSLMRTTLLTPDIIDTIFQNCIYLESLELIECPMLETLCIDAHKHKHFKTLVVSALPNLTYIMVASPTLKYYKYKGYVNKMFFFGPRDAFKEVELHYIRNFRCKDPSHKVVSNIAAHSEVSHLATTTIFLEAFKYTYIGGGQLEKSLKSYKFNNLTTFQIHFKAPTFCTLFDIAEFLKMCPNLVRVVIDINEFTFERNMFWEIHYKYHIKSNIYLMSTLKEVKICGYKGDLHEFDIVLFFIKNALSLKKLVLERPTNPKINLHELYDAHIDHIKSISPRPDLDIEES